MTPREFHHWLEYHQVCLPTVGRWLAEHQDAKQLTSTWQASLSDVQYGDARAATDAIVSGDLDRPFPEDTVRVVRRHALSIAAGRRTSRSDEPNFEGKRCGLCDSTGHVTIWHPLVARGVFEDCGKYSDSTGAIHRVTNDAGAFKCQMACIACKCSIGDRYTHWMRKKGDKWERVYHGRYGDSRWHIKVQFRTLQEIQAMSVKERVLADIDAAGGATGAVEWEFESETF